MSVVSYMDLEVWQAGMRLAETCYRVTAGMSADERFELKAQMRRAAVSIPSNIAEGHNRRSSGALLFHLSVALGSQAELETQIELSVRLGLLPNDEARALTAEASRVGQLLSGFVRSIKRARAETAER